MSVTTKPTPAAMRAAEAIYVDAIDVFSYYDSDVAAAVIDRETGLPELIEALERCHKRYCPSCADVTLDGLNNVEHWEDVCKAVRAALAKARA